MDRRRFTCYFTETHPSHDVIAWKGSGLEAFYDDGPHAIMPDHREKHDATSIVLEPAPGHNAKAQKAADLCALRYKPPLPLSDGIDWHVSRRLVLNPPTNIMPRHRMA